MRVTADSRQLAVEPGKSTTVVVSVVNTDAVIDGVSARVLGIASECVSAKPALLPLFPDASGTIALDLTVPASHPAGRHPLSIEVVSHGTSLAPQYVDLELDVAPRPGLRMEPKPSLVRGRRSARYLVNLANYGNVPLAVSLNATDPNRHVQARFTPERQQVPAGSVAPVMVVLRGPRMLTGGEVDRNVTISAAAEPLSAKAPASGETSTTPPAEKTAGGDGTEATEQAESVDTEGLSVPDVVLQFRQRPTIGRGVMTVLTLASIIALWAVIFLVGLAKVFGNDPMTKAAPASFFASIQNPTAADAAARSGPPSSRQLAAFDQGPPPAGALPKNGDLPPGMGGTVNGTVDAADDAQPTGRITVQAYRLGRTGLVAMSSAATQTDGTYSLAGLFPTSYYLKFSATGYRTTWYPGVPSRAQAKPVAVPAQGATSGINVKITGEPARITGTVNPGDTLRHIVSTVTARPLQGPHTGRVAARATTKPDGSYILKNLPAPNSYELIITTPGYQAKSLVDSVDGGENRLEPMVILGASTGQISGVVSDNAVPLGNARIQTTVSGSKRTVVTPTTGQVGAFVLDNLPTPATYVLTFSSAGHATVIKIVDLAAGQSRTGLNVDLASGTGSITGRVVDAAGHGLGGATVTVGGSVDGGGAATPPSAKTLTTGDPGAFTIANLKVPGSYTLAVTLSGYSPVSIPVQLTGTKAARAITVTLSADLGAVSGTVFGPDGHPLPGAMIVATNGRQSLTATSNSSNGRYLIANLPPGTYSVTATDPGMSQQTAMIVVRAGQTDDQDLRLGG